MRYINSLLLILLFTAALKFCWDLCGHEIRWWWWWTSTEVERSRPEST